MVISGQDFSDEIVERIRSRIEGDASLTRTALSHEVCHWLGWFGSDGQAKDVSCRAALRKLADQGSIMLPAGRHGCFQKSVEAGEAAESVWLTLDTTLAELGQIRLIPVDAKQPELSRTWWSMIKTHHPLKNGALFGAQLRYLIACEAGYLGALSFSAPAWRLAARDRWIGWDDTTRRSGLGKIVGNSRFVILPTVRVPNLASHVLSQALRRLAQDWQTRYGISPVLVETFVDRSRYAGICYKAANWQCLGQTKGRGRQDRLCAAAKTIKDIWVYPLRADCQTTLQGGDGTQATRAARQLAAKQRATPAAPTDWAEEEFGNSTLTDARLQSRLYTMARDFYARPTGNITQACASRAKTKAAYRFLDHDETTLDTLLQPHFQATAARIQTERVVLAVQDTTSLNYTTHKATEGIGAIGTTVDGPQGLHLHSTLAFNTDGTPLGFVDVQCWARDAEDFGKKACRHRLPIEEKESFKWLKSYRAVAAVQADSPNTTLVSVGDREADIYALFAETLPHPEGPKLLVRAKTDRKLRDEQQLLWAKVQSLPAAGVQVLKIPRQGSRQKRDAHLTIRYAAVTLVAPNKRKGADIPIWAVLAEEQNAPAGVTPLSWMLLTTMPVTHLAEAIERLKWYALRWGIEVFHRTLKSGCGVEKRQLQEADRLEACLAIDLVVAWRIYYLNKLGRETPDVPCSVVFEEAEWKALTVFTSKDRVAPATPPSLRVALRLVAGLGGFLGRKCDGEPGTQTLWIGLQRLADITATWRIIMGVGAGGVRGIDSG